MLHLVTPQSEHVADVAKEELDEFLAARGLTSERSLLAATVTVFDPKLRTWTDAEAGPSVRIVRSHEALVEAVDTSVDPETAVVYRPRKNVMRHYHTTSGFVAMMEKLAANRPGWDVVLPPGLYGQKYMFALRSRAESTTK